MNCKPGDLAVVVRSKAPWLLGRVVTCVRLHDSQTHDLDGVPVGGATGPRWVIDPPLDTRMRLSGRHLLLYTLADKSLRPLRNPGDDAQDETLSWKPVPQSDEVPA
jgi:hypothetical protein